MDIGDLVMAVEISLVVTECSSRDVSKVASSSVSLEGAVRLKCSSSFSSLRVLLITDTFISSFPKSNPKKFSVHSGLSSNLSNQLNFST